MEPESQEKQEAIPSDIDDSDSDHTQDESSLSTTQMGALDFVQTTASFPITGLHITGFSEHTADKILVKQATETESSSEDKIPKLDTVFTALTTNEFQIADNITKPCSSAECPFDTSYQDGKSKGHGNLDRMSSCHSFESILFESETNDPHHSLNSSSSCVEFQNAPDSAIFLDALHAPIVSHVLSDSSLNCIMGSLPQSSALSDISPGKLKRSGTFTKTLAEMALECDSSCTDSSQIEISCCTSQIQHLSHEIDCEITSKDKETHICHDRNILPDKVEVFPDSNTSPGNLKRSGTFTKLLINEPCETVSCHDRFHSDIILRQTNEMHSMQSLFTGEHNSQPAQSNCQQIMNGSAINSELCTTSISKPNTGENTLEHASLPIAAVYKKPPHLSDLATDQMYPNYSSKRTTEEEKQLECYAKSCNLINKSEHPKCISSSELTLVYSSTTSNEWAVTDCGCNFASGEENGNAAYLDAKCTSDIGTFKDGASNGTVSVLSVVDTMDSSASIAKNVHTKENISPKLRRSGTFSKDTASVDLGNTHYSSTNANSCTTEDHAVSEEQGSENDNSYSYLPLASNYVIEKLDHNSPKVSLDGCTSESIACFGSVNTGVVSVTGNEHVSH